MTTSASEKMFYTPEPERRWVIDEIYDKYLEEMGMLSVFREMEKHPQGPGYSDVGTRNLTFTLVTNMRPRRVLEIGTHIGVGSLVLGAALRRNNYGKLLTVEPMEVYRATAMAHISKARLEDIIEILPFYSTDPSCKQRLTREAPFEIIYIDADHRYENAERDIELASSLLVDNGIMILHDAGRISNELDTTGRGGVRQAAYDFCQRDPSFSIIFFEHPLWMNACGLAVLCKQRLEPAVLRYE